MQLKITKIRKEICLIRLTRDTLTFLFSTNIGILHTNISSLNKHCDDLTTVLLLLEFNFQVIGTT